MENTMDQSQVIPEPQQVAPAKKPKKKLWILIVSIVLALAVAAVAAYFIYDAITNTYKSPITLMEKQANSKTYKSNIDEAYEALNGFARKESKAIVNILKKSDDYKDSLAENKENFKDTIDQMKDDFGSNYKIKYKIEDKEKLDKDALKEFEEDLEKFYDDLEAEFEETEDWDSDDWEENAEDMGLSKSQLKDLYKNLKSYAKKLKSAKVTAGYELSVTMTLTGSELDEPMENEGTLRVYKVNGRWVTENALTTFAYFAG